MRSWWQSNKSRLRRVLWDPKHTFLTSMVHLTIYICICSSPEKKLISEIIYRAIKGMSKQLWVECKTPKIFSFKIHSNHKNRDSVMLIPTILQTKTSKDNAELKASSNSPLYSYVNSPKTQHTCASHTNPGQILFNATYLL
jgi:hypothetical protein